VGAKFSGAERHKRRLAKIAAFEADFGAPLALAEEPVTKG
jgi:hypothetical protein